MSPRLRPKRGDWADEYLKESCIPAPCEAYPLIREGREAGARSAVEWEGDSWAYVPGGKNSGSIAREGLGGVGVCLCVGASALPADSGYSLHLRNLEVDDQKHTCLPVQDTYGYRGNKDIPLPL